MKKGSFFINSDTGEVFEITGVFMEVKKENGEVFSLKASTLALLFEQNLIRKIKKIEDAS